MSDFADKVLTFTFVVFSFELLCFMIVRLDPLSLDEALVCFDELSMVFCRVYILKFELLSINIDLINNDAC